MNYWLVKSPFRTRSWQDVLVKGVFKLYGIRNHQSRNNISKMKTGDKALFYHGPSGKQVYGVMQVVRKAYLDPTSNTTGWLSVDFEPVQTFDYPISLSQIRSIPEIENTSLIKQPRVTVSPLTKDEFERISEIAIVEGKG